MKLILSIFFCVIYSLSYAAEYQVITLGTESISEKQWYDVKDINDQGQVIGTYHNGHPSNVSMYFFDPISGIHEVPSICTRSEYGSTKPVAALNNNGEVFSDGKSPFGEGRAPFIWTRELGMKWINVFGSSYTEVVDFNDLSQGIGIYNPIGTRGVDAQRPFYYDNGIVKDMGPGSEFGQNFESLWYHVLEISFVSINNKGEIAGNFTYGKFNEKQKKFIRIGQEAFFWDGNVHVITVPKNDKTPSVAVDLNNKSEVLVHSNGGTYIWNLDYLIETLADFSVAPFFGISFNDTSIILGRYNGESAIWRNGEIIRLTKLLEVNNLKDLAPPYSEAYKIEKIEFIKRINNKNQILCNGWLWAESHPCILEPIGINQ